MRCISRNPPKRQLDSSGLAECKVRRYFSMENCPFNNSALRPSLAPCLQHDTVPPNIHCRQLNPRLEDALAKCRITFPMEGPLALREGYAGVSSFGFSQGFPFDCQLLSAGCDTYIQGKETCTYLKPQKLSSQKLSNERKPSMLSAFLTSFRNKT